MIVEAVGIVLVILLIANVGLSVFNSAYPPCDDVNEYFASARKINKDSMRGLRTVQSGTDINYVGAKLTSNVDGEYVLKSRNEDYDNPPKYHSDQDLLKAINIALGGENTTTNNQETSNTDTKYTEGLRAAIFETELEGLKSDNRQRKADPRSVAKPAGFIHRVERDGYSDRKVSEW